MKSNPIPVLVILLIVGARVYMWIDPGKPTREDLAPAVETLFAQQGDRMPSLRLQSLGRGQAGASIEYAKLISLTASSSSLARSAAGDMETRVWPIQAKVLVQRSPLSLALGQPGIAQPPSEETYSLNAWKNKEGKWEVEDGLQLHWNKRGYFGFGFVGM